jgi:hypothetical protein
MLIPYTILEECLVLGSNLVCSGAELVSCALEFEEEGRIRVSWTICLCILRVIISGCITISERVLEARRHYTHLL